MLFLLSSSSNRLLPLVIFTALSLKACSYFHPFPRCDPTDLLAQVDRVLAIHANSEDIVTKFGRNIRSEVQEEYYEDLTKYSWLDQGYRRGSRSDIPARWVSFQRSPKFALSTEAPVLDEQTILLLREVASKWWNGKNGTSRFTYQRTGNQEAHLGDLCAFNKTLKAAVRANLFQNIFPLVEEHFLPHGWTPHIYDSIIIRYNATAAIEKCGAGQPLHRDMARISVNIMLNEGFTGGGTLFEAQLREENIEPLKPKGVGHALLHSSSHRHAGVGTRSGVRDILVLFLTATNDRREMSPIEESARIKGKSGDHQDFFQRALVHRTAIDSVVDDGEAYHYLGMCIQRLSGSSKVAPLCLMHASLLLPNDARLWNNLGLTLGRQGFHHTVVEDCYCQSLELHKKCQRLGCDVESDLDTCALNYGLFLANRDRWDPALKVLQLIGQPNDPKDRLKQDADKLRSFCSHQLTQEEIDGVNGLHSLHPHDGATSE